MALSVKGCGGGGSGSDECTATKANLLAGKTAITSDSDDEPIEGTMVNRGAVSTNIGVGGSYTIPQGYHNGSGKVTGPTLSGNAAAANVLTGKTFYSNSGTKQTGTMANQGAVSKSLGINGTYTIPAGYHNGSGKVTQSITAKAAATYTPGTSNQTIAAGQYLSGAQTIKGDANLVAANIVNGKSIFGVSGTVQKFMSKKIASETSETKKNFVVGSSTYSLYIATGVPGFTPVYANGITGNMTFFHSLTAGATATCYMGQSTSDDHVRIRGVCTSGCVLTASEGTFPSGYQASVVGGEIWVYAYGYS